MDGGLVAALSDGRCTRSWGEGDRTLIATCPMINATDIGPVNVIPLNPIEEKVYEVRGG